MAKAIRLALLGDSHVGTYLRGIEQLGVERFITGYPLRAATGYFGNFFSFENGTLQFLDARTKKNYQDWQKITGISDLLSASKKQIVLSMGLAPAPFYGARMWQEFSRNNPKRQLVTSGMLFDIVTALQQEVLAFYDLCFAHDVVAAVLPAPAPQMRHRATRWLDPDTVLELDKAFRKPVEDKIKQHGCPLICVPEVTNSSGYLKEEYYGSNWAHANAEYGALIIRELLSNLGYDVSARIEKRA